MKKKMILVAIILFGSLLFISTYTFANNDDLQKAGNSVRNTVGDVEKAAETVGNDVAGGVKDGFNKAGDATKNAAEGVKNATNNGISAVTNNDNNGYDATRTATGTFAGMNGTVWTWFILAIVALAIIGLVWYYSTQNNNSHSER